jgi:hypothetical protein
MVAIDPLIEHGLRFGGLFRVTEPQLIERYNKALVAFGYRPVAEAPLYIDLSGFSLEVANALDDLLYLNPAGVNTRFIIVSADQGRAPLVHTTFSSTKKLLQAFFDMNRKAIELITLKDALYGEIENTLLRADSIEDVIAFPHVDFEFHTVDGLFEDAVEMEKLIGRFRDDEAAWTDVVLMEAIVRYARKCGDIRKNPLKIKAFRFAHPKCFSTTLFGGATILDGTVVGDRKQLLDVSNGRTRIVDTADIAETLRFLDEGKYLEPVNARWLVESEFLDHRLEMLAADILAGEVPSIEPFVTSTYPEIVMQNNVALLMKNPVFKQLDRLRNLIANARQTDVEEHLAAMSPVALSMIRRAVPGKPFTNDVNRILSTFSAFDYLSCFILDKPTFYAAFKALDDIRRDFAVKLIQTRYMPYGAKSDHHKSHVKEVFFGAFDN